ncbi:MAG: hypothetical protein BWY69_01333 [Planctomycetes bacterium ADurb.Bin401]|nr:MAG: hypothetical protein BWY69_01333 [Planctomycetes bacterium ADurb.Bin401]
MPATGSRIGTPASISASVPPQTDAIELDPFDSVMSETIFIVYGNASVSGFTLSNAFSANAPWPISRLPGPRIGFTSPTE